MINHVLIKWRRSRDKRTAVFKRKQVLKNQVAIKAVQQWPLIKDHPNINKPHESHKSELIILNHVKS